MSTQLIVFDFDGTMTNAEAEGLPFRMGYLGDLATLVDRPLDEVIALADAFDAKVAADPGAYGWLFNGSIVAPATVDPYLRVMPSSGQILDHYGRLKDPLDRQRVLESILYKYNYAKTDDVPWPGTAALLKSLEGAPLYIVTNSHTDVVQRKVRALGADWLVDRVFGQAKKYVIDDGFETLPVSLNLPGLERPVLLRRRLYFEVLDRLRKAANAEWSDVLVVGDIFELDLAVPFALGARVALMSNAFTPSWEKNYLADHPRGQVLTAVDQIPSLIQ